MTDTDKQHKPTRDELRGKIFSSERRKSLIVDAFGIQLEVKQPALGDILDLQDMATQKERVTNALINYCYVPGTNEKVFEVADADSILSMPFDANFEAIQNAITSLTGVDIEDVEGNLEGTTADIT